MSDTRGSVSLVPAWTYAVINGDPRASASPVRWIDASIVAAMHAWEERYGSPPRSYEWAPSTGRAAGLLPEGPARWELEYPRWPATGTVATRFGSWCNGLRAAGMPARIPEHELPRHERIHTARRLAALGVSQRAIADTLGVAVSTVSAYLHGGTCPACGGPLVTGAACRRCAPRRVAAATRDEVLTALRTWSERYGRAPTRREWGWRAGPDSPWVRESPRWPSASSVHTHFGSWNAALEAAGVPLRRHHTWDRERMLRAIREWAAEHDGVPPRYADFRAMDDRARWPDPKTVATAFGGWTAARTAAGFD